MRYHELICEGMFDNAPAAKADAEIQQKKDDRLGTIVTDTLIYKSSHPHHFEWPIAGDDILVLEQIEASEPGRGYGKRMLNLVCRICDKHGVKIYLDANTFGRGLNQGALQQFYAKAGFQPHPAMAGFAHYPMIRLPKKQTSGAGIKR